MKKVLIIGGGILTLGGVAYFLYMNKKKKDQEISVSNQDTTEANTTSATTSTTAPIDVEIPPLPFKGVVSKSTALTDIEEQRKLDRARDIYDAIMKLPFSPFVTINTQRQTNELLALGYEIKGSGKSSVL